MSAELYLISCVKAKLPVSEPVRARDLYISPWFKRARTYVESTKQPWFILSAKYGLVCPNAEILPYAKTLNSMPKERRCEWANDVLTDLELRIAEIDSIYILAGQKYREFLEPNLRKCGVNVYVPMAGLRISEQLSWLNLQLFDLTINRHESPLSNN